MIDIFLRQAEAVGAECHRIGSHPDAIDTIVSTLQKEGVAHSPGSWAVWAVDHFLSEDDRQRILRLVPGVRFDVSRQSASEALVGISEMDFGVARTGTLLSDSSSVNQRLVSTLPPVHIAILPVSRIVADLATALTRLDVRRCPFVAAITGPSRTADIERVLTIGVHGPRRLVILLVGDPANGGASQ
jgi:L-lactate dehydrogenase complex protein LldG